MARVALPAKPSPTFIRPPRSKPAEIENCRLSVAASRSPPGWGLSRVRARLYLIGIPGVDALCAARVHCGLPAEGGAARHVQVEAQSPLSGVATSSTAASQLRPSRRLRTCACAAMSISRRLPCARIEGHVAGSPNRESPSPHAVGYFRPTEGAGRLDDRILSPGPKPTPADR